MKKIITITVLSLLMACIQPAHSKNMHRRHDLPQHRQIHDQSHHWVYVSGHYRNGVWVQSRWVKKRGTHPHAHKHNWHRIPGRWVGHGINRHWVNPHWENNRVCRHRR
jgi:hypothetical protein